MKIERYRHEAGAEVHAGVSAGKHPAWQASTVTWPSAAKCVFSKKWSATRPARWAASWPNVLPEAWRRADSPASSGSSMNPRQTPSAACASAGCGSTWCPAVPTRRGQRGERLTTVTIEQHLAVEDVEPDGTPAMLVYWPVASNVSRRGGLEFSHPTTELELNEARSSMRTALLVGGMIVLSACWPRAGTALRGAPLRG